MFLVLGAAMLAQWLFVGERDGWFQMTLWVLILGAIPFGLSFVIRPKSQSD